MRLLPFALAAAVLSVTAPPVRADEPTFTLTIRDHRFEPAQLEVPAGVKFQLVVKNLDATAEEFDSKDLKREKVIAAGKSGIINLGPLNPGTYRYVGEYHEATAKGELVAK